MRPTRALLVASFALCALGVATAVWPTLASAFTLLAGALVVLTLSDALALTLREPPSVERSLSSTLSLGARSTITLTLRARRPERLVLHDRPPEEGTTEGLPARVTLLPGRSTQVRYTFRPLVRGELTFAPPSLELTGPLGLLERERHVGAPAHTRVYPNFERVAGYVTPGQEALLRGAHLSRRRGEGREFHQLREYREGDSLRQVDWKSVARRQQLISREYRSEQNQNVVFLIDCGRRMRAHDGEFRLLDQALDALLLLAHVALRQGDSVGMVALTDRPRWLAPVRGAAGLNRLLESVYDLESSAEPCDYEAAVALFASRQRRRALLVVITNLGDDELSALRASLASIRGKHLVLVASMRDPELAAQLTREIHSDDDATSALSVLAYLDARRSARSELAATGVMTLESNPAALPEQLVDRYLTIKRAGAL